MNNQHEIFWINNKYFWINNKESTGIIFGKHKLVIMAYHVNTSKLYKHSLMELPVLSDTINGELPEWFAVSSDSG